MMGKSLVTGVGDADYFGVEQYEYGAIEHYRFAQPQQDCGRLPEQL